MTGFDGRGTCEQGHAGSEAVDDEAINILHVSEPLKNDVVWVLPQHIEKYTSMTGSMMKAWSHAGSGNHEGVTIRDRRTSYESPGGEQGSRSMMFPQGKRACILWGKDCHCLLVPLKSGKEFTKPSKLRA